MSHTSRIRILQVEGCPLVSKVIDDLERCLTEADLDEPVEIVVGDHPSPTLLIDDLDVATWARVLIGWSRRPDPHRP